MPVPPFSETGTLYDMNSYWGRVGYWAQSVNPLLVFETERSLQKAQLLLDSRKDGLSAGATDAELWKARNAIEQCVHPTTKEPIFPLFRMCAFLPANFLIVPFMMTPSTVASVPRTLFIQWLNQSYNSAVNYANRSSDKQPTGELLKAYTAAVVIACGAGLGATMLTKRVAPGTTTATLIRATVPFAGVVTASVANLALMRKNEWMTGGQGIQVKDEDGTVRGYSTNAGKDSLLKCSATRVIWNFPCMMFPTLLMLPLSRLCAPVRRHSVVTEALLQMAGLTLGVPPALAAYNVVQAIPASKLEEQFQGLKRQDGSPVQNFTYYKGL